MPPPNFLTLLPRELRDQIYIYAACHIDHIIISNHEIYHSYCKSTGQAITATNTFISHGHPPLSQANRQLRHEVLPIFYQVNTFSILDIPLDMTIFYPFRHRETPLKDLDAIDFRLETSWAYHHSLTKLEIQPVGVVRDRLGKREEDLQVCVKWQTHQGAVESLRESPRKGLFLTRMELAEENTVEDARQIEIMTKAWEADD